MAPELVEAARCERKPSLVTLFHHLVPFSDAIGVFFERVGRRCSFLGWSEPGLTGLVVEESYLGNIDGAVAQPIEGAHRAQTGTCQHNWQARSKFGGGTAIRVTSECVRSRGRRSRGLQQEKVVVERRENPEFPKWADADWLRSRGLRFSSQSSAGHSKCGSSASGISDPVSQPAGF